MRSDLAQILLEHHFTPRGGNRRNGPSKGYKKKLSKQIKDGDAPYQESMKIKDNNWYDRRNHDYIHYGILRKEIEANCGRLWADVWSDFCRILKGKKLAHARNYILREVSTNVKVVDGIVYDLDTSYRKWFKQDYPRELIGGYYVDPATGILTKNKKKHRRYRRKKKVYDWIVFLNENEYAMRDEEGIWWNCTMVDLPEAERYVYVMFPGNKNSPRFDRLRYPHVWDSFLKRLVNRQEQLYGTGKYCVCRRQMNKKEIHKLTRN